ncbi:thioredoxin [Scytonema sp. NUACC21]
MFFSSPVVAATSSVSNLNADQFETEVLKSDKPVLVGFTARWSAFGTQAQMQLEDIANTYPDEVKVYAIDIDDRPDLVEKYDVNAIPNVLGFKGGSKSGQYIGPTTTKDTYLRLVK